jgi:hypothetical protein
MFRMAASKRALMVIRAQPHTETASIHSTDAPNIGEEVITPMLIRKIFWPAESTDRLLGTLSRDMAV